MIETHLKHKLPSFLSLGLLLRNLEWRCITINTEKMLETMCRSEITLYAETESQAWTFEKN